MRRDPRETLVPTFLDCINVHLKCYIEKYQDIPLEAYFDLNLDNFWEELIGVVDPDFAKERTFHHLKKHLIQFQKDRNSLSQKHVTHKLKYIYIKEFYWAISGFLFGEDHNVSKRLLFVELLYKRHQIFSLLSSSRDLTLDEGKTYYGQAIHGFYEKYGNNFGMNDYFFRPEDVSDVVCKIIDPIADDGILSSKIAEIDRIIEGQFGMYDILKNFNSLKEVFH